MKKNQVQIRFWGVRGSVPTPLTSQDVKTKFVKSLTQVAERFPNASVKEFLAMQNQLEHPFTYGGNTSCVEVRYGNHIFALDMGTGLRPFGNSLFAEMFQKKGINVHFFISHVHWDHIQGLPFFGPLYVNKETGINNEFHFFGGTDWQKNAETCLRGQMDPPNFPVSFRELMKTTRMSFEDLYDMMNFSILGETPEETVRVTFRKLNHPQETYGVRMEFPNGQVIAYTTDNEPYDPKYSDPKLVSLAKGADVWITDCQYTREVYTGERGGLCRHGWGHSYPEAVVETGIQAGAKKVILFHHDPGSSDEDILNMQRHTQALANAYDKYSRTPPRRNFGVQAAYEGLEITL